MAEDSFYTPDEIAELLKVAPGTVRHWIRTGQLPGVRVGGRFWRVRSEDLEAFLDQETERT